MHFLKGNKKLNIKEAKKIGFDACAEKLGKDFVHLYKDKASFAYGFVNENMSCFIGVDSKNVKPSIDGRLILENKTKFKYRASCIVNMTNGEVEFMECVTPTYC